MLNTRPKLRLALAILFAIALYTSPLWTAISPAGIANRSPSAMPHATLDTRDWNLPGHIR